METGIPASLFPSQSRGHVPKGDIKAVESANIRGAAVVNALVTGASTDVSHISDAALHLYPRRPEDSISDDEEEDRLNLEDESSTGFNSSVPAAQGKATFSVPEEEYHVGRLLSSAIGSTRGEILAKAQVLGGRVPASRIPSQCYVYDTTPKFNSVEKESTFPSAMPTSRAEVLLLADAMDILEDNALHTLRRAELQESIKGEKNLETEETRLFLGIVDVIFCETIRQVTVHCCERGLLLEKLRERLFAMIATLEKRAEEHKKEKEIAVNETKNLMAQMGKLNSDMSGMVNMCREYMQVKRKQTRMRLANASPEKKEKVMRRVATERAQEEAFEKSVVQCKEVLESYEFMCPVATSGMHQVSKFTAGTRDVPEKTARKELDEEKLWRDANPEDALVEIKEEGERSQASKREVREAETSCYTEHDDKSVQTDAAIVAGVDFSASTSTLRPRPSLAKPPKLSIFVNSMKSMRTAQRSCEEGPDYNAVGIQGDGADAPARPPITSVNAEGSPNSKETLQPVPPSASHKAQSFTKKVVLQQRVTRQLANLMSMKTSLAKVNEEHISSSMSSKVMLAEASTQCTEKTYKDKGFQVLRKVGCKEEGVTCLPSTDDFGCQVELIARNSVDTGTGSTLSPKSKTTGEKERRNTEDDALQEKYGANRRCSEKMQRDEALLEASLNILNRLDVVGAKLRTSKWILGTLWSLNMFILHHWRDLMEDGQEFFVALPGMVQFFSQKFGLAKMAESYASDFIKTGRSFAPIRVMIFFLFAGAHGVFHVDAGAWLDRFTNNCFLFYLLFFICAQRAVPKGSVSALQETELQITPQVIKNILILLLGKFLDPDKIDGLFNNTMSCLHSSLGEKKFKRIEEAVECVLQLPFSSSELPFTADEKVDFDSALLVLCVHFEEFIAPMVDVNAMYRLISR